MFKALTMSLGRRKSPWQMVQVGLALSNLALVHKEEVETLAEDTEREGDIIVAEEVTYDLNDEGDEGDKGDEGDDSDESDEGDKEHEEDEEEDDENEEDEEEEEEEESDTDDETEDANPITISSFSFGRNKARKEESYNRDRQHHRFAMIRTQGKPNPFILCPFCNTEARNYDEHSPYQHLATDPTQNESGSITVALLGENETHEAIIYGGCRNHVVISIQQEFSFTVFTFCCGTREDRRSVIVPARQEAVCYTLVGGEHAHQTRERDESSQSARAAPERSPTVRSTVIFTELRKDEMRTVGIALAIASISVVVLWGLDRLQAKT